MKKNILILVLILMGVYASAETYVQVYEVPYGVVDGNSNNYKKLYKETTKSAPISEYKISGNGRKEYYLGSKGVRVTFDASRSTKSNFNALMDVAAKYARKKLKRDNGYAISKMLLELKED